MSRPVVGVSSYVELTTRGEWVDQLAALVPIGYARHIERAGGLAVVLPPRLDADDSMAEEVLGRLDAVILAGGADVDPERYAAEPHPTVQAPRPDRDAWETALARASLRLGTPTLGICRGMQVMAVTAGGVLEQHVPDRVETQVHAPHRGAYGEHLVTPVAGTRLATILDEGQREVPTYHHQSVHPQSLEGTAYVPSAWHTDGTLEAMEDPGQPFRLAVQWHPEAGEDGRLFQALIAASRRSR